MDDDSNGPRLEAIPGKLVYVAEREGDDGNIYVTDQQGTRQLTRTPGYTTDPAWSPDGQRIAYADGTDATTLGPYLYLMDADGTDTRFLKAFDQDSPQALAGFNPAWSPDGQRIAYDACANCELGGGNYDIWVVEVAGETFDPAKHHRLTEHPAKDRFPTWNPDGTQVAFVSNRAYVEADSARYRQDLYVVNADGTDLRRLTETGQADSPIWNPDGNTIAYGMGQPGAQIFLFDLTSKNISRIKIEIEDDNKLFPIAWSPDGTKLMLTVLDYPVFYPSILDMGTEQSRRPLSVERLDIAGLSIDWLTVEN
ncbi:MAG: hypothetical protein GVY18_09650 [Bacteroidetes bacterium]|jgi:TolB protein|nr:hypothetical protein [Bacteroidota bacterium]